MENEKRVMDPMEVAKALGVNRHTVYSMLRKNLIPHVKCGDKYLIGKTAFETWLSGEPQTAK